jgi:hypothetical protein
MHAPHFGVPFCLLLFYLPAAAGRHLVLRIPSTWQQELSQAISASKCHTTAKRVLSGKPLGAGNMHILGPTRALPLWTRSQGLALEAAILQPVCCTATPSGEPQQARMPP